MVFKMATYKNKGYWNIDLSKVKEGDEFVMCNMSQSTPSTEILPDIKLTFKRCNLSRVLIQPSWKVTNCNTSNKELPPEHTEEEIVEQEAENLATMLKDLAHKDNNKYAKEVSKAAKKVFSAAGMTDILSADGKPAKVEDLSGEWAE